MQAAGAVFLPIGSRTTVRRLCADLVELLGDKEAVPVIGDDAKISQRETPKACGKSAETDSRTLPAYETAWERPPEKLAKVACRSHHTEQTARSAAWTLQFLASSVRLSISGATAKASRQNFGSSQI